MVRRFAAPLMLVCMLVGLLVGTAGSVAADTQWTCPDSSCSFAVPDSYSKLTSDGTSIIFQDSVTGGTFTVALVSAFSDVSLPDAAGIIAGQLATLNSFQPDPAGVQTETVGNNPASSLVFSYVADNGSNAKAKAFFSVYQNKLYLLQFATSADQEDAFVQSAQGVFNTWIFM